MARGFAGGKADAQYMLLDTSTSSRMKKHLDDERAFEFDSWRSLFDFLVVDFIVVVVVSVVSILAVAIVSFRRLRPP